MAVEIPQRVLDRVWDRIDSSAGPDACWPWKLSIGTHGYGTVTWWPGSTTAHRAAWTAVNGPIPDDLTVDHLCRNRLCCNPTHLRLLSNADNAKLNGQAVKTHCKHGHEFTAENTYVNRHGHRACRACARIHQRKLAREARTPAVADSLYGPTEGEVFAFRQLIGEA